MPTSYANFFDGRQNQPAPAPDHWYLLKSGLCGYDYNMALDEALMEAAPQTKKPVLRFYGWTEKAASFGYSQSYSDIERITALRPLVRRPTGGGLVPHDRDWTYSVAIPAGHYWYHLKATESYLRVHEWVRDAFRKLEVTTSLASCAQKDAPGQCFVGAEKSDVLWRGRKIAGAAQRRTHHGLLIQGSVQAPPDLSREAWQEAMCQVAVDQFGAVWAPMQLEAEFNQLVARLVAEKYSRAEFNRRR